MPLNNTLTKPVIYPQRPVRAVGIALGCLSPFVLASFFIEDINRQDWFWFWMFGYCAFLSLVTIGILRNGARALLLWQAALVLATLPGGAACFFFPPEKSLDTFLTWISVSHYLIYVIGVWGLYLVVRG